ncbi:hypothetical protein ACQJBY_041729 [Aegilops geniculata]
MWSRPSLPPSLPLLKPSGTRPHSTRQRHIRYLHPHTACPLPQPPQGRESGCQPCRRVPRSRCSCSLSWWLWAWPWPQPPRPLLRSSAEESTTAASSAPPSAGSSRTCGCLSSAAPPSAPLWYNNVVLIGDGVGRTIITGALSDRTGHNVMQSATMSVFAEGFMARDVTIQNTAGGPGINQAVALRVQADRTVFYRCQIHGYQDTLMAESHLQFYRECEISGTVDFIFGDATAVFQDCIVFARRPADGKHNVITAQGRGAHLGGSGFVQHHHGARGEPQRRPDLPGPSLEGPRNRGVHVLHHRRHHPRGRMGGLEQDQPQGTRQRRRHARPRGPYLLR